MTLGEVTASRTGVPTPASVVVLGIRLVLIRTIILLFPTKAKPWRSWSVGLLLTKLCPWRSDW